MTEHLKRMFKDRTAVSWAVLAVLSVMVWRGVVVARKPAHLEAIATELGSVGQFQGGFWSNHEDFSVYPTTRIRGCFLLRFYRILAVGRLRCLGPLLEIAVMRTARNGDLMDALALPDVRIVPAQCLAGLFGGNGLGTKKGKWDEPTIDKNHGLVRAGGATHVRSVYPELRSWGARPPRALLAAPRGQARARGTAG